MASKTTQNQNQITRWSVMLGVNPGYDNTVHFTPDLAIQKAIPFIRQRFSGYSEVGVAPAAAVYNRAWGCPDGGEVGCEFPYKSRVMPTSEPLKTLKAPYMARNTMKWGFFRLKSQ